MGQNLGQKLPLGASVYALLIPALLILTLSLVFISRLLRRHRPL